mmetsp:Transcript_30591/g.98591  ORF Transcript_30591/g.98591 Transcript_30591/m.98591 type:complete len:239 (-) Transcript_30591:115-831(-)
MGGRFDAGLPDIRFDARLASQGRGSQSLGRRRLPGRDPRGRRWRGVFQVKVRIRRAPRPARPCHGVPGPRPHLDGDRRHYARSRRRPSRHRPERYRNVHDALRRRRRPERQQSRNRHRPPPQAHGHPHLLHPGKIPAQKQGPRHAPPPEQALRNRTTRARLRNSRPAPHASRHRIALRKNSHLQLEGLPLHRPPPQPELPPRQGPLRRLRTPHRRLRRPRRKGTHRHARQEGLDETVR